MLTLLRLAFLLVAFIGGAWAQDFPNRPVKLVVPFAPGGLMDVLARLVGQRLTESVSQQFVVENKPGAGGIQALQSVINSPPDGYNLVFVDVTQTAINPHVFTNLPFDAFKELVPISIVARGAVFVAAKPVQGTQSFPELLSYARLNPGKLNYGSAGVGSIHHIAMEVIKSAQGLQMVHVPYKSSSQSVPALVAGEVQVVMSSLPALEPHVKAGKIKLLAATSASRSALAPDVPAVSEFIPGYDFSVPMGFMAARGTAPAIVSRLAVEIAKASKHPETVARLTSLGNDPVGSTPEEFATVIRENQERYATAVKLLGAKVN